MSAPYDPVVYERFVENMRPLLSGPNIRRLDMKQLRRESIKTGTCTKFGSYGWRSMISSRIAPKTVYLGSDKVVLPKPTDLQLSIVEKAPDELHTVLHYLRTLPFAYTRRQMGDNGSYNPICNLYVSVADQKNYRLAYMWANTMFDPKPGAPGPEFTMIHIPEEHGMRQQVLAIPEHYVNIALGTDYMGEDKKGFLRQAMWTADNRGMMGLHAGSKIVTALDAKTDSLRSLGVFMFGLTATGKSTWSCHQLGLDPRRGEKTRVAQDDIVFLRPDGSAFGSEGGYFVKTDVDPDLQEAMYNALVHESALYENVMIDAAGNPDFLDETLTANGRAVIKKDELKVLEGKKKASIALDTPNLPSLDENDVIVFAFITRRNTIMPFSQELTPEQGVLAYLWGESTHSYATTPAKAGESTRVVGTDPFIVGSRAAKVNRFYDIVMDLVDNYPGRVRFMQYNTGGMGEVIRVEEIGGKKVKRMIRKASRVPIDLMAAIQRGDLRGTNTYAPCRVGTMGVAKVEGADLSGYEVERMYDEEQIQAFLRDLVDGRRRFTDEIASEGLRPEIVATAEKSFEIVPESKRPVGVGFETPEEPASFVPKKRPRRPAVGRL
jgi:phosphoenolpyruvate carboxykinase (ATP)